MIYLKKLNDENIKDNKILYDFLVNNNPHWKQTYIMELCAFNKKIPNQGSMNDFEYFIILNKLLHSVKWFLPSQNYMLFDGFVPVTHVYTIARNKNVIDIGFATDIKMQGKGYATKALTLIEEILFKDKNIIFTTISDISVTGASSKIALKAGYIFDKNHGYFIKFNPSKNIEDFMENRKTKK